MRIYHLLEKRLEEVIAGVGVVIMCVMVFFQVVISYWHIRNPSVRYFAFGTPHNGIQHYLTEITISPIPMIVASRKPEPTPTVWTFGCPGYMLYLAGGDCCPDIRVSAMWSVGGD